MKLIAHRGNLYGPNPDKENHPDYITSALKAGHDVEVDVWYQNKKWYLGHDNPKYQVKYDFLAERKFWLHAKNGDAFHLLLEDFTLNVFWHTDEDWVLTSKRYIWTYPTKQLYPESICVMPERGWLGDLTRCHAVCTDYVTEFPEKFENEYWIH